MNADFAAPATIVTQEPRRDFQATTLANAGATTIYAPTAKERPVIESINAVSRSGLGFSISIALVSGGVETFLVIGAMGSGIPFRMTDLNLPLLAATDFLRAYGPANVDIVVVAKTTSGNLG